MLKESKTDKVKKVKEEFQANNTIFSLFLEKCQVKVISDMKMMD